MSQFSHWVSGKSRRLAARSVVGFSSQCRDAPGSVRRPSFQSPQATKQTSTRLAAMSTRVSQCVTQPTNTMKTFGKNCRYSFCSAKRSETRRVPRPSFSKKCASCHSSSDGMLTP